MPLYSALLCSKYRAGANSTVSYHLCLDRAVVIFSEIFREYDLPVWIQFYKGTSLSDCKKPHKRPSGHLSKKRKEKKPNQKRCWFLNHTSRLKMYLLLLKRIIIIKKKSILISARRILGFLREVPGSSADLEMVYFRVFHC